MIIRSGNLFDTDALFLSHGVNIHGLMGAGIAKEFKTRYPENYKRYRNWCHYGRLNAGDVLPFSESGKTILNMATQDRPGKFARYEWVEKCAERAVAIASAISPRPTKIAAPAIGCGIGGLEWNRVGEILEASETPKVQWEVWFL